MATTPTSTPAPKTNRLGLQVIDYRGGKTTLCAGCGHNAISERVIDAMYEMGVQPERVSRSASVTSCSTDLQAVQKCAFSRRPWPMCCLIFDGSTSPVQ